MTTLSLSDLDDALGFRGTAAQPFAGTGFAVSAAGDVNGDGFDDVIVGETIGNVSLGAAYVLFGGIDPGNIDLSTLDGSNGFRLVGAAAGSFTGRAVGAVDINGDGFDDLLIGANGIDGTATNSGAAYVVFGKAEGFAASIDLGSLDADAGFRLVGTAHLDNVGVAVSAAGDVNADGFEDLLVGANGVDANGIDSGAAYVIYGKAGGFGSEITLAQLDTADGFRLSGVPGDAAGGSVSAAGDVNGDGIADLLVGASSADQNGAISGATYVVFGRPGASRPHLDLASLDGREGFRILGLQDFDAFGACVSDAGDMNGDGLADFIAGTWGADPNAAYVVFGRKGGLSPTTEVSALNGANGFRIHGGNLAYVETGRAVSAAGDINLDGFDDVILSARDDGLGSSFIIFGKAGGFAADLHLDALAPEDGLRIAGSGWATGVGHSVSAAGDVDGDGFPDVVIGGLSANAEGVQAHGIHVVYGGDFSGRIAHEGTGGNDLLTGTDVDEIFVAGAGRDTLAGGGGRDVLHGGHGDDLFLIDDALDVIVESAGGGFDMLQSSASAYALAPQAHVETLLLAAGGGSITGNARANNLLGNGRANVLAGGEGNDTLDGGGGADTLMGGGGDDTYLFRGRETIVDSGGDDVALAEASVFAAPAGIEDVILGARAGVAWIGPSGADNHFTGNGGANRIDGGTGNDLLEGGRGDDTLLGGAGSDTLDGGRGADVMEGGAGDDVYLTGSARDRIVELAGAGRDTVQISSGRYDLAANLEDAIVLYAGGAKVAGNALANVLNGGAGNDTLEGGGGADRFVFDETGGIDLVLDFTHGVDRIVVDSAAFGTDIAYDPETGALFYGGAIQFAQLGEGAMHPAFTTADIQIV